MPGGVAFHKDSETQRQSTKSRYSFESFSNPVSGGQSNGHKHIFEPMGKATDTQ